MARIKEAKNEENVGSSKDFLNEFLKQNAEDHYGNIIPQNKVISTGSLILDSLVKIRSGSIIRLAADQPELGKTSQALVFAQNYMDTMPKSKAIFIKAEARLSPEMQKRSGCKFVTNVDDWNYGTIYILASNIFETIADGIETMLKRSYEVGDRLCIIIDSLDGLILKNDLQTKKLVDGQKVAGVQLLTKLMFKRIGLPIAYYDALLIATTQYSAAIQLDMYSKNVPRQISGGGGASISHQSDYVFSYSPRFGGDYILENPNEKPDAFKNKTLGVYATLEIKKSGTDVTGSKVKIPIKKGRIGCAIWKEKEVVDLLLGWSLLNKKGAWFNFNQELRDEIINATKEEVPESFQGMQSVYDYIEKNEKVRDFLVNKISELIN